MPSGKMTETVDAFYEATRDWFTNVSQNLGGLGRARANLDAAITSLERERDEAVRMREHEAQLRVMLTEGWEWQVHELQAEVERLKDLCLRAAGYIGVRQGPEVDKEADALLKELRGET